MANSTSPIQAFDSTENSEATILSILSEAYPNLDCGPGTPVYELLVRPHAYVQARQNEGTAELINATTLINYPTMNPDDMDRIMSRLLVERRKGRFVNGTIRCITRGDSDLNINAGEIWEVDAYKTYEVLTSHNIKQEDWEDITPLGAPIHWYTDRIDAIAIVRRIDTFSTFKTIIDEGIPVDTGKYMVTDEDNQIYIYDASKAPRYDPSDPTDDSWKERLIKYTSEIDHPVPYTEIPDEDKIYYEDVAVASTGTGSAYNANQNDQITPTGPSSANIAAAYFLTSTNDGGRDESNFDFYIRAKDELSFRGLCSYKSICSMIYDRFSEVKQVVPIGIHDNELVRDLASMRHEGRDITIHTGGKADVYVNNGRYFIENGYKPPLGFPLTWGVYSMKDAPQNLMTAWNNSAQSMSVEDRGNRGSLLEKISDIDEKSSLTNLKCALDNIHTFLTSSNDASITTDLLVKEMWPIVVVANIKISSNSPENDILLAKETISEYINTLNSNEAPQIAELAHILRNAGIQEVHVPLSDDTAYKFLQAYYIRDDTLQMEWFGLKGQHSSDSLLVPTKEDSLAFQMKDPSNPKGVTQISIRTCTWYTNPDLINIEVV